MSDQGKPNNGQVNDLKPLVISIQALGNQIDLQSNGSPKMTMIALTRAMEALLNQHDIKKKNLIEPVHSKLPDFRNFGG